MNRDLKLRLLRVARISKKLERLRKMAGAFDPGGSLHMTPKRYESIGRILAERFPDLDSQLRKLAGKTGKSAYKVIRESGATRGDPSGKGEGLLYSFFLERIKRGS